MCNLLVLIFLGLTRTVFHYALTLTFLICNQIHIVQNLGEKTFAIASNSVATFENLQFDYCQCINMCISVIINK